METPCVTGNQGDTTWRGLETLVVPRGTERCYGAGGEEMAPSSLREPMECPDAPAKRLEQVPERPRISVPTGIGAGSRSDAVSRFAPDSPLEQGGFELPVPVARSLRSRALLWRRRRKVSAS